MKKFRYQVLVPVVLVIAIFSCEKKPIERFVPDRMFTPTGVSFEGADTVVTISWPSSLFSQGSGVTYTVEVSRDSMFQATPDLTLKADTNFRSISDDTLKDRTPYFARVKANATSASTESGWVMGDMHFTLVGVQIFHPVLPTDIIDNSVILNWIPTPGVNRILLTAANGDTVSSPITADENTAGQKIISGLTSSTAYTAEIFAGNRSKGIVTFTTKAKLNGDNIVDLRDITDRPQVNGPGGLAIFDVPDAAVDKGEIGPAGTAAGAQ